MNEFTEFHLTFGVPYSVGTDRLGRQRCNVPVQNMTVQVSEATYQRWYHDALDGGAVDPLFHEPIDDYWWTSNARCNDRLSVSGTAH